MSKTKFTRFLSLTLAVMILVSSAVISVSAAKDGHDNTTDKSIHDFVGKLNTISYAEYMQEYAAAFAGAANAKQVEFEFDATEAWSFKDRNGNTATLENGKWTLTSKDGTTVMNEEQAKAAGFSMDDLAYIAEYDGIEAVYTPNLGATTWTLNLKDKLTAAGITGDQVFNIGFEYYPISGKPAAIEREFYVNSEAPFSEARALVFSKIWSMKATDGVSELTAKYILKDGDDLAAISAEATAVGLQFSVASDSKSIVFEWPDAITSAMADVISKYALRYCTVDKDRNELRPTSVQDPEWCEMVLHDSNGYYTDNFGFVLTPDADGNISITLEGVNECMAVSKIVITSYTQEISYADYYNSVVAQVGDKEGTDVIKLEAETPSNTSTNTVYPVEDRVSAATSPADTTRTVLNTIGGSKWATAGQWVEYRFQVNDSGFYNVYSRFKQSFLDGMYVNRLLKLYTDYESAEDYAAAHGGKTAGYYDGIPFAEAAALRYDYNSGWQVTGLSSGNGTNHKIYLEAGVTYTIHFEVTLGSMNELVRNLEDILNILNNDYLSIIKLTGTDPDTYRDYAFNQLLPDTLMSMMDQAARLEQVSAFLKESSGDASTYTGVCDKLVVLLRKMAIDEDEIAKNLNNFKSYVGSLGTFLSDAKTQPMQLDFIVIQPSTAELPEGEAGFLRSFWHELKSFAQSFIRDYNQMGAMENSDTNENIEVWLPYGRDQANVIRNLATNQFTADTKVSVDLKLVTGGTLLPSILAGMGPDVYMGLTQATVINYAIRGALTNIEDMEGFSDVTQHFNNAAMIVLGTEDAEGVLHYYGLPENQDFSMMFIRIDILSELGIEIPTTWEEIYVAQSTLESNNMEIGIPENYRMHLYQMEGELFADNGMRINLDSIIGLKSFETMCNMFTQYSFPKDYDAANRFRTGEMPIIVSNYTALYNKLKVFATEIEGSWIMVPLPGYTHVDENGNTYINNESVADVDATVMISGSDHEEAAWKFMKWYTGAECQVEYANEMVAIIGDSAKHPTANREALKSLPWSPEEYEEISKQYENLASVPNYPGYYIISRYTNFAFLDAYNEDADPGDEMLSYINTINKEITRKREEFKLETLEIGQTLADKRTAQALKAMEVLEAINADKYANLFNSAKYAIANDRIVQLMDTAEEFSKLLPSYNTYLEEMHAIENDKSLTIAERDSKLLVITNKVKTQSYFKVIGKQTAEPKNGGYQIDSLNEEQLIYFIAECLDDTAKALASY